MSSYQIFPTDSYQSLRMATYCRKKSFLAWINNFFSKISGFILQLYFVSSARNQLQWSFGCHFVIYSNRWFLMNHFAAIGEILKALTAARGCEPNPVQLKTDIVWMQLRWSHVAYAITFPLWLSLVFVAKRDRNYTLKIDDLMKY